MKCDAPDPRLFSIPTASNKSLDRSGGSVFRIKSGAAKVEWNRAARSTLTFGGTSKPTVVRSERRSIMQRRIVTTVALCLTAAAGFAIGACTGAGPTTNALAPSAPIVVCSNTCAPPLIGQTVFLDPNTGDLWAYSGEAMLGAAAPVRMGKLVLGKAVER